MRDITLKIIGKQCYDGKEEDQMEFITDGQLYVRDDSVYMIYDESEVSGMTGCKTTLKVKGDSVKMRRIGEIGFNTLKKESASAAHMIHLMAPWTSRF